MEDDRFFTILRRHFPDAIVPERALKDFQKALLLLDASYARLHRDVRKALSDQFHQNERERVKYAPGFSLCGKNASMPAEHLINHIRSLFLSITGTVAQRKNMILEAPGDGMQKQPSAIKTAGDKIASMRKLTGKAAKSEAWTKIAGVERAIRCWDRYGTGEAKLHSREFLALLQDLIDALGRR